MTKLILHTYILNVNTNEVYKGHSVYTVLYAV